VYKTPGDVVDHLRMRVASDKKRYMQYYGIDHMDKRHYDYVLDTTKLTLKQVIENVMVYVKAGGK
jgi:cytidylate kinase